MICENICTDLCKRLSIIYIMVDGGLKLFLLFQVQSYFQCMYVFYSTCMCLLYVEAKVLE